MQPTGCEHDEPLRRYARRRNGAINCLDPHPADGDFRRVDVGTIGIVAFLSNLARAGVDTYLVRLEPAPDQRIYDIAITLVLFISAALSLLGAISVPLLIRWFHGSEFVKPYLTLLLSIPV